jgi:hypothetical protein
LLLFAFRSWKFTFHWKYLFALGATLNIVFSLNSTTLYSSLKRKKNLWNFFINVKKAVRMFFLLLFCTAFFLLSTRIREHFWVLSRLFSRLEKIQYLFFCWFFTLMTTRILIRCEFKRKFFCSSNIKTISGSIFFKNLHFKAIFCTNKFVSDSGWVKNSFVFYAY